MKVAISGLEGVDSSEEVELSVVLSGDSYIQELNNDWLGIDEPTDVLSFPQNQTPGLHPTVQLTQISCKDHLSSALLVNGSISSETS